MKRRLTLYIAIVCFCFSGIAYAVLPLALLPGVALVFESGAMAVGYAAAAALIGSALAYITFSDSSASPDSSTPPIYARLSPDAPVPTPLGWDPGQGGADPTKPATTAIPDNDLQTNSNGTNRQYSPCYTSDYPNCHGSLTMVWTKINSSTGLDSGCKGWITSNGASSGAGRLCYDKNSGQAYSLTDEGNPNIQNVLGSPADPNANFPPDGILVLNHENGNWAIHPKDMSDATNISPNISGGGFTYDSPDGSKVSVTPNGMGMKVESSTPNTTTGTVQHSAYDIQPDGNGKMVLAGGTTWAVPGGVGTNPGQSAGTGEGGCGGPGRPACTVDDSGFSGHVFDGTQGDAEMQAHVNAINEVGDLDVDTSFLPDLLPGAPVACRPIPVNFTFNRYLGGLVVNDGIDICAHLEIVRTIFGYLFGFSAVIYIWRRFSRANNGA